MSRIKTFGKYVSLIILFWILSDVLIYVGLNSTYKDIDSKNTIPTGINVIQMQATKVNGRVVLNITNPELSGKFLKIDLYSDLGNLLGTKYLEIGSIEQNQTKTLDTYFKITDVKLYEINVVDEIGESTEGFMDMAMSTITVALFVLKIFLF